MEATGMGTLTYLRNARLARGPQEPARTTGVIRSGGPRPRSEADATVHSIVQDIVRRDAPADEDYEFLRHGNAWLLRIGAREDDKRIYEIEFVLSRSVTTAICELMRLVPILRSARDGTRQLPFISALPKCEAGERNVLQIVAGPLQYIRAPGGRRFVFTGFSDPGWTGILLPDSGIIVPFRDPSSDNKAPSTAASKP